MRLIVRNKIVDLLITIDEGVKYAQSSDENLASIVLNNCLEAISSIYNSLKSGLSEERAYSYAVILNSIIELIEEMYTSIHNKLSTTQILLNIENLLTNLKNNLQKESEVKLEILFLPYKSSMWDSMESIWIAAKNDSRCNCNVVPIPYYDKNTDNSFREFHYDGKLFPNDVPITNYESYDINSEKPDAIYIHNPFDQYNYVTSVDPRFYSSNLKNCTAMLVYVPYFVSEVTYNDPKEVAPFHMMPSVYNVNKIIVQSKVVADAYIASGCPASKLSVLGSPKFDSVTNLRKDELHVPNDWKQKIQNKKVFWFNTSISEMLTNGKPGLWISYINNIIDLILNNKNNVLLWRPHPLLESTIHSMRPQYYDEYIKTKERIINSENAIYDDTSNYHLALSLSDALISDNSSIIRLYLATGKSIYMHGYARSDFKKYRALDFSACVLGSDITVSEFIEKINAGIDEGRDERLRSFKNSVVNSDGTCGYKVNQYIINEVL